MTTVHFEFDINLEDGSYKMNTRGIHDHADFVRAFDMLHSILDETYAECEERELRKVADNAAANKELN